MSKDADVDRLKRHGIEALMLAHEDEPAHERPLVTNRNFVEICRLALQSLSQEAVRDEVLEDLSNLVKVLEDVHNSHKRKGLPLTDAQFAKLNMARSTLHALKREPNAEAESYESAHPKALDEPAPAAPYVDRFYGPQDPGFWAAVSDRRFSNEYIGIALRGWLDAQSPKDARSLR